MKRSKLSTNNTETRVFWLRSLIFMFCTLYSVLCIAQSPNYVWARNADGYAINNISEGFTIASDGLDDVFITGYYSGTTSFGNDTLKGGMPYLTKYDGSGNVLWAKDGKGSAINRALAAAPDGHAFVAGTYLTGQTATFGSYSFTCIARQDVYAVGYDPSGNVKWAFSTIGTTSSMQEAPSIAADAFGNAYLLGDFDAATLSIGTATINAVGGDQVFLAKIDSSGNVLWARGSTGGVLQNDLAGKCVATDNAGNVYILGTMRGTSIKFGTLTDAGVTGTNIFLAKYDSSGNPIWAKAASASNINAIETDPYDNSVYISGAYSNSAKFDTITLTNAGANTFIAKYDTAGNALWAKSITGPNTTYCIAPNNGKVYISGKFTSTTSAPITFDAITITQPAGSTDPMWFAGYYSTGNSFFANPLISGGDDNNGIAASSGGCLYLGGDFQPNPMILGNDTLRTTSKEYAFVTKLCYSSVLTPDFTSSIDVFCNESGQCIDFYDQSNGSPISWKWSFPGATPDTSNQQNPTNICYYTPGTYAVKLIISDGTNTDSITVSPKIIFASAPPPPVLTFSGDTIYCGHAVSYQWYFNGSLISGANDSFYVNTGDGVYAVQITDANGCSVLSNGLTISVNELNGAGRIEIYPNPAGNQFMIYDSRFIIGKNTMIEIYNMLGEKVLQSEINNPKSEINVSGLVKGIYMVEVNNAEKVFRAKFVKE